VLELVKYWNWLQNSYHCVLSCITVLISNSVVALECYIVFIALYFKMFCSFLNWREDIKFFTRKRMYHVRFKQGYNQKGARKFWTLTEMCDVVWWNIIIKQQYCYDEEKCMHGSVVIALQNSSHVPCSDEKCRLCVGNNYFQVYCDTFSFFISGKFMLYTEWMDHLCGLVVRLPGC
jgi:hypothetical protein